MSGVEWGAEIPVNGVRPVWLEQPCKRIAYQRGPHEGWYGPDEDWPDMWSENDIVGNGPGWANITAIRLPASHFAYTAIAKGFEPWSGGDDAPGDWDEGEVLCADGRPLTSNNISWWTHGISPDCADIIGYRKRKQPEKADAKVEPSHVSVKRMTQVEAEAFGLMKGYGSFDGRNGEAHYYGAMRDLGLIRPETHVERIATKTGLTVAQVEAVLAANDG